MSVNIVPERDRRCVFPVSFTLTSFGGDCLGATVIADFGIAIAVLVDIVICELKKKKVKRLEKVNTVKWYKALCGGDGKSVSSSKTNCFINEYRVTKA